MCGPALSQEPPTQELTPAVEPALPPADDGAVKAAQDATETPVASNSDAEPAVALEAETGRIVFFRPSRLSGAIYTYRVVEVGDDGKPTPESPVLGGLKNGGAFSVEVEPRLHTFNLAGPMAFNKAEDRLRMEVEPGETYYVEQQVRMGLVTGGFRLVPADETRFIASNAKLAQEPEIE